MTWTFVCGGTFSRILLGAVAGLPSKVPGTADKGLGLARLSFSRSNAWRRRDGLRTRASRSVPHRTSRTRFKACTATRSHATQETAPAISGSSLNPGYQDDDGVIDGAVEDGLVSVHAGLGAAQGLGLADPGQAGGHCLGNRRTAIEDPESGHSYAGQQLWLRAATGPLA